MGTTPSWIATINASVSLRNLQSASQPGVGSLSRCTLLLPLLVVLPMDVFPARRAALAAIWAFYTHLDAARWDRLVIQERALLPLTIGSLYLAIICFASLNNDHLDPFSRSSCPFLMARQCLSRIGHVCYCRGCRPLPPTFEAG